MREVRRSLDTDVALAAAQSSARLLLDIASERHVTTVAAYQAIDGEVDPTPFIDAAQERGWTVALPVVADDRLRFVVVNPDTNMARHRWGMDEPVAGDAVDLSTVDMVVMPSVAVDPDGHRIGFGGGYYDRTLGDIKRSARPLLVALCHEQQVVDGIDAEAWDVPVDVIVTGSTVRWCEPPTH